MKNILTTLALLLGSVASLAQNAKVDDAKLLEYYQAQRYQDAAAYLKQTYAEPITDLNALSRLAYTTEMAKNLPEAQAYYQRIYDIDTTNEAALFSIANINLRRGNSQKAEDFFKKILAKDTTNATVYTKLAALADNKKDTLLTIYYLQKANNLNQFDIDVAVDLSGFYIDKKKFDQALVVLNKAAESDPDNMLILHKMVILLFKEKKYPETITACLKLIGLKEADADILYKLGVSYYNLKNYACGAETLTSISGIDQTEYSDYFTALCYKGLKDYTQSQKWLTEAIRQGISINIGSYYGEIADVNESTAQYKKAVTAYQKALEFSDNAPTYCTAMAELYETKLKDHTNALIWYKKATAAYERAAQTTISPMLFYSLANIYDTKLKDTAKAVKYYNKFIESKPSGKQQTYVDYTKSRIGQLQTKN